VDAILFALAVKVSSQHDERQTYKESIGSAAKVTRGLLRWRASFLNSTKLAMGAGDGGVATAL
jgi:hypothetical protein